MLYIVDTMRRDEKGGHMRSEVRGLDETTHRAAKVAAAQKGISYNQFLIDAIRAAVLRAAQKDRAVAVVLESAQPARS